MVRIQKDIPLYIDWTNKNNANYKSPTYDSIYITYDSMDITYDDIDLFPYFDLWVNRDLPTN